MILKVAKLGVKVLRMRAHEVDPVAVARGDYEPFLADLEDTMREYEGTGIAAPQVFTPLCAFLYEVHPEKRNRKEKEVALTGSTWPMLSTGRPRLVIDPQRHVVAEVEDLIGTSSKSS